MLAAVYWVQIMRERPTTYRKGGAIDETVRNHPTIVQIDPIEEKEKRQ
jgi:hypothetical protein